MTQHNKQNKHNQHSDKQYNASKSDNNNGPKSTTHGDTSNRGFAAMDPEKQREIASKGGKNSHKNDNR